MQNLKSLVALETALGPVYNEFCYNEQSAITSKYYSCEDIFVTDINVKKISCKDYHLHPADFCECNCSL